MVALRRGDWISEDEEDENDKLFYREIRRIEKGEDGRITVSIESYEGPLTRQDCMPGGSNAARPCPWATCKYNLRTDIRDNGRVRFRRIAEGQDSCELDVRERHGEGVRLGLRVVARAMGLSKDQVHKHEQRAMAKLRALGLRAFTPRVDDEE